MFLFKTDPQPTTFYDAVSFKNESEIHVLISSIISKLFDGAVLLGNEFQIQGGRIDTLAYDKQAQAFLIIEYQGSSNHATHRTHLIDQIRSYASTFRRSLHQDSGFQDEVAKFVKSKTATQVVLSDQAIRLIVIKPFQEGSPPFTSVDINKAKESINSAEKVELYGIQRFGNNLLFVEQFTAKAVAKTVLTSAKAASAKHQGKYDEQYFTSKMSPPVRKAYARYKEAMIALCQPHILEFVYNKDYTNYKVQDKIFAGLSRKAKQIQFTLNLKAGELNDSQGIANLKTSWHYGTGDYGIDYADYKDLDQVMDLIRQSYNKNVLRDVKGENK